MGYPNTVDIAVPIPLVFSADGATSTAAAGAVTAGSAFAAAITIYAQVTIAQMRTFISGTPTGNIDMGIYDSSGTNGAPNNLMGHTGAIAATTGAFTQSLTANLPLSPGVYWLAFLDTVADSIYSRTEPLAGMAAVLKTTATNLTVLPASWPASANTTLILMLDALRSGGWS